MEVAPIWWAFRDSRPSLRKPLARMCGGEVVLHGAARVKAAATEEEARTFLTFSCFTSPRAFSREKNVPIQKREKILLQKLLSLKSVITNILC